MPPDPIDSSIKPNSGLPDAARRAEERLFFGGSFDPPHLGHSVLPESIRDQHCAPGAWLIYIPAARSPHKDTDPTPPEHRVAMLRIALESVPNCTVWETEIDRQRSGLGSPSYWIETWDQIRHQCVDGRNRFLIGTDQALAMHRWHRFTELWKDALVMLRDEFDSPESLCKAMRASGEWNQQELDDWQDRIVVTKKIHASSTEIRTALANPRQRENPIIGLDDRVHAYILENWLYRG